MNRIRMLRGIAGVAKGCSSRNVGHTVGAIVTSQPFINGMLEGAGYFAVEAVIELVFVGIECLENDKKKKKNKKG